MDDKTTSAREINSEVSLGGSLLALVSAQISCLISFFSFPSLLLFSILPIVTLTTIDTRLFIIPTLGFILGVVPLIYQLKKLKEQRSRSIFILAIIGTLASMILVVFMVWLKSILVS
jgi:hypothetical protein